MHYAEVYAATTTEFCFICGRLTDHVVEHDDLITCEYPDCAPCAAAMPAITARREADIQRMREAAMHAFLNPTK